MEEKILIKSKRYNIDVFMGICIVVALVWFLFVATDAYWLITITIGLAPLLIFLLIFAWLRSYEIIVTDKRVYGREAFGKRVDLPIDSIAVVGSSWPKGIAVATSSGKIAFLLIKNRDEIHECITDLLIERQNQKAAEATVIKQEPTKSNADELKKYKELLDMGVITQEEFDAKKKQLLGL